MAAVHKMGNAKVSGQHFSSKRSLLTPSEDDFIQSFEWVEPWKDKTNELWIFDGIHNFPKDLQRCHMPHVG